MSRKGHKMENPIDLKAVLANKEAREWVELILTALFLAADISSGNPPSMIRAATQTMLLIDTFE